MPELAMYALRISREQPELDARRARLDVHDTQNRRIAILDEDHMILSDGLSGMRLRALRRVVMPEHLLVPRQQGHTKLMREQDVAIRHQDRIADLALAVRIDVLPDHFPAPDNEHPMLLLFARVEKVVLC